MVGTIYLGFMKRSSYLRTFGNYIKTSIYAFKNKWPKDLQYCEMLLTTIGIQNNILYETILIIK